MYMIRYWSPLLLWLGHAPGHRPHTIAITPSQYFVSLWIRGELQYLSEDRSVDFSVKVVEEIFEYVACEPWLTP